MNTVNKDRLLHLSWDEWIMGFLACTTGIFEAVLFVIYKLLFFWNRELEDSVASWSDCFLTDRLDELERVFFWLARREGGKSPVQ